MAVDYGMLSRIPSVGARFAAGQEAGRAAAAQNMLLQQRAMEFQQAQEDRKLAMDERRMQREAAAAQVARRGQLAQLLRQSGMDPSDMQSATQFYAAALEANEPTAIAAAKDWLSIARETAQSRAAGAEYQGIMGGAPAPAPMAAAPAPMPAAAPMAAPPVVPPPAPMAAPEPPPFGARETYGAGEVSPGGAVSFAVAPPPAPMAPAGANMLAPQAAPPVNAMLAPPPAAAPAPAAAPTPAPAKDDAAALRAEAQRLEAQQQRLRQSGFKANQERAKDLDKPIERLYKRAEDVEKAAKPAEAPVDLRMMDALGIPRTEAGFARFNELKQRPEAMSALSRLIAERDRLPPTDPNRKLFDDAIKKATTQVEPAKVEVKLPPQPRKEQEARGTMLVEQYKIVSDAARLATRTLPTLETQERILDAGFRTGFGAEAQKAGASLLAALGVPEAKEYATNAQAFSAAMNQAVLQKQLEQKGVQTQADADRITQTGAQLTNTADANRFIIAVARAQLKRDIAQRNFYDKWWKDNGTYDGAEDAWATGEGNKSLFESPELKRFAAPASQPAAAPANAGAYSDPDKERRYQEWKAKQGAK